MTKFVAGKLHGIHVTEINHNYQCAITLDPDHCDQVGFVPMELVEVWNRNSGARTSAYVTLGERASRCCILHGAVARICQLGDPLVVYNSVYSYGSHFTEIVPRILIFDCTNHVVECFAYPSSQDTEYDL